MANNNKCIFCNDDTNFIEKNKVFEDSKSLVILDKFPITYSHLLVIPKSHYKDIQEIDEDLFIHLNKLVYKVSNLIHHIIKYDGLNIVQNNGISAYQSIFHFHIHIIPRYSNNKYYDSYELGNKKNDFINNCKNKDEYFQQTSTLLYEQLNH